MARKALKKKALSPGPPVVQQPRHAPKRYWNRKRVFVASGRWQRGDSFILPTDDALSFSLSGPWSITRATRLWVNMRRKVWLLWTQTGKEHRHHDFITALLLTYLAFMKRYIKGVLADSDSVGSHCPLLMSWTDIVALPRTETENTAASNLFPDLHSDCEVESELL